MLVSAGAVTTIIPAAQLHQLLSVLHQCTTCHPSPNLMAMLTASVAAAASAQPKLDTLVDLAYVMASWQVELPAHVQQQLVALLSLPTFSCKGFGSNRSVSNPSSGTDSMKTGMVLPASSGQLHTLKPTQQVRVLWLQQQALGERKTVSLLLPDAGAWKAMRYDTLGALQHMPAGQVLELGPLLLSYEPQSASLARSSVKGSRDTESWLSAYTTAASASSLASWLQDRRKYARAAAVVLRLSNLCKDTVAELVTSLQLSKVAESGLLSANLLATLMRSLLSLLDLIERPAVLLPALAEAVLNTLGGSPLPTPQVLELYTLLSQLCMAPSLGLETDSTDDSGSFLCSAGQHTTSVVGSAVMSGLQSYLSGEFVQPGASRLPGAGRISLPELPKLLQVLQQYQVPLSQSFVAASVCVCDQHTGVHTSSISLEVSLRLYAAALPVILPRASDIAVRLAAALMSQMSADGNETSWQAAQHGLQLPRLSRLVASGVDSITPDSSLQLLCALVAAGADLSESEQPLDSRCLEGSKANSGSIRHMVSCLLQACVNSSDTALSEQQLLAVVSAMLHLQVPPSRPTTFLQELCAAVEQHRSAPTQLLLRLPQAAALCGSPLPQDFFPLYESMLVGKALQQQQTTPGRTSRVPDQAPTPTSLTQGASGTAEDSRVAPQLAPLVLRPLLAAGQPVTCPLLLALAASSWLDTYADLRHGIEEPAGVQRRELLPAAATILLTVSAGQTAPFNILQDSLDLLATQALQLASAEPPTRGASTPLQGCGAAEAALVIAVGCFVAHLGSAPKPVSSSQPFQLAALLPPDRSPRSAAAVASMDGSRLPWVRSAVTILSAAGSAIRTPGQASSGLPTSELIRLSHSITVALGQQLAESELREEVRGLLTGPVARALVSQGFEQSEPAELLQLAQAWDAMQLPVGIKVWQQWRSRLTHVLPAVTPTQAVAMLRCSSFLAPLGPPDASQRAAQRVTSSSVIRQVAQALLSSQVAMFVLEMRGAARPSAELKAQVAAAALQQLVLLPVGVDSTLKSLALPSPPSSISTSTLLSSQSTASSRASILLMMVLASLDGHLPTTLPAPVRKAVAAVVQHCHSAAGVAVLDSCSSLELRFMLAILARQFSAAGAGDLRSPAKAALLRPVGSMVRAALADGVFSCRLLSELSQKTVRELSETSVRTPGSSVAATSVDPDSGAGPLSKEAAVLVLALSAFALPGAFPRSFVKRQVDPLLAALVPQRSGSADISLVGGDNGSGASTSSAQATASSHSARFDSWTSVITQYTAGEIDVPGDVMAYYACHLLPGQLSSERNPRTRVSTLCLALSLALQPAAYQPNQRWLDRIEQLLQVPSAPVSQWSPARQAALDTRESLTVELHVHELRQLMCYLHSCASCRPSPNCISMLAASVARSVTKMDLGTLTDISYVLRDWGVEAPAGVQQHLTALLASASPVGESGSGALSNTPSAGHRPTAVVPATPAALLQQLRPPQQLHLLWLLHLTSSDDSSVTHQLLPDAASWSSLYSSTSKALHSIPAAQLLDLGPMLLSHEPAVNSLSTGRDTSSKDKHLWLCAFANALSSVTPVWTSGVGNASKVAGVAIRLNELFKGAEPPASFGKLVGLVTPHFLDLTPLLAAPLLVACAGLRLSLPAAVMQSYVMRLGSAAGYSVAQLSITQALQVGDALLQLHGPLPPALLPQFLLRVSGQTHPTSPPDLSDSVKQRLESREDVQLWYGTKQQQQSPALRKSVSNLLNQAAEAVQSPTAAAVRRDSSLECVTYPAGTSDALIRLWERNSPAEEHPPSDGILLGGEDATPMSDPALILDLILALEAALEKCGYWSLPSAWHRHMTVRQAVDIWLLLGAHPSVNDAYFQAVRRLINAPFLEGHDRLNALAADIERVLPQFIDNDRGRQDRGFLAYLQSVSAALLESPAPQHGTLPGRNSRQLLTESLQRIGGSRQLMAALPDQDDDDERARSQLLRDTLGAVLVQVLNIPVLPGESSRLMKAWTRVRYHAGEIKRNTLHPLHRFGWAMASGLGRSPGTQGVSVAVNTGPTRQASSRMSDAQSDVEFMEAVYDSGMYMAANAPVTLSLHRAGITRLDDLTLSELQDDFFSSGYGSMMGPNRDAGLPFEVTALLLSRLVQVSACEADTEYDGQVSGLPSALAPHSPDCAVGEVYRTTQAVTLCRTPRAWGVAESAPMTAAAAPTAPTAPTAAAAAERTAATPTSFFCQRDEPWSSVVDGGMVRALQRELITGVDAAMAAAAAAGKPVGVVQLMSWLEPLLYRPFASCKRHLSCLDQLPLFRWLSSAISATVIPSSQKQSIFPDPSGRHQLLSVAVMWPGLVPALQVLLQQKGKAGVELAVEMGLARQASEALQAGAEDIASKSPEQLAQARADAEVMQRIAVVEALTREQQQLTAAAADLAKTKGVGFARREVDAKQRIVQNTSMLEAELGHFRVQELGRPRRPWGNPSTGTRYSATKQDAAPPSTSPKKANGQKEKKQKRKK
ncbi:MAG: hypothetical protein WDW38_010478 [Sanguina aurantia]